MCPAYFLSNRTRWCFRSSIVAPLKSRTLTTWLLFDSRFSSSPVNIECSTILSVYNPAAHACLKLSGVSSFMTISVFSLFLYSEHLCFICFRPPMAPDHTKSNSFEAVSVSAIKKSFCLKNWFLRFQYPLLLCYGARLLCKTCKILVQYIPISRYLNGLFWASQ